MSLQEKLDRIKKTPLYPLSHTSKELFHSNFIAWFIECHPVQGAQIISRMLHDSSAKIEIVAVKREKEKNKDIIIDVLVNGSNQKIVIENKVKSLPDLKQLEKYSHNKVFTGILLSLVKPSFTDDKHFKVHDVMWEWVTYGELASWLTEIYPEVKNEDEYHGYVLNNYIDIITVLDEIPLSIDWENGEYDFGKHSIYAGLQNYRFHDVYEKVIHEQFAHRLYQDVLAFYPGAMYTNQWQTAKQYQVLAFSTYPGHTGALAEIKYMIGDGINLTIQIQRGKLNIGVESLNEKKSEEIAHRLLQHDLWFDFKLAGCNYDKVFPKDKGFKTFSELFKYRAIQLPPISYTELLGMVHRYVAWIEDNKEEIIKCIH